MENRKQIKDIVILTIMFTVSAFFLVVSFLYYEGGEVGKTIVNFGCAMLIGMYSTAGIIYYRLKGHLLLIEKLIEKQIERIENKENK